MTAHSLITRSLWLSGQLGPGRGTSVTEQSAAMEVLNSMLGTWATQRLTVPVIRMDQYDLVAGTQAYTLGDGGDFGQVRPVSIERANLVWDDHHRPLDLITVYDWADIRLPDLSSTMPQRLYNDRSYPLATLRFYPTPNEDYAVELFTRQALTQITSITEELEFVPDPPGYEEAVKYNLAVRLKALFPKALNNHPPEHLALITQFARESLANIKRVNKLTPVLRCERIGVSGDGGRFDYRTGE